MPATEVSHVCWRRRTLSCFMRIDSHHMEKIMKLNPPTQDTAASNARRLDDGSLAAHLCRILARGHARACKGSRRNGACNEACLAAGRSPTGGWPGCPYRPHQLIGTEVLNPKGDTLGSATRQGGSVLRPNDFYKRRVSGSTPTGRRTLRSELTTLRTKT